MTGLELMILFGLAYLLGMLLAILVIYVEARRKKRLKDWEENKTLLALLFLQTFLMVVTIFYLAAARPSFPIWLTFAAVNTVAFIFACLEALYRRNVLAALASIVAFTMLILFGL